MVGEAKHRQRGYVALISVLIIGAAAAAIGFTLLSIGIDAARTGIVGQQTKQARSLAAACAQEALQLVNENVAYSGSGTLSRGQGTCGYTVYITSGTARTITAYGTVGNIKRKVQVAATVNASTVTVTSWQEEDNSYQAIVHVQNNTFTVDTTATTIAQTFLANTTAGNAIVAAVSWDTTTAPVSLTCTDSKGDAFTTAGIWNDTTNTQALGICYATNVAGGTTTVTATFGATSTTRRIIISEYSGIATSSPVDVSTGVGGGAGTITANAVTSGTATTTLQGDLIFGAVIDTAGTATITAGTNFTQRAYANVKDIAIQDFQQGFPASVASTQTFGTAHRYSAGMVAFKAATQ